MREANVQHREAINGGGGSCGGGGLPGGCRSDSQQCRVKPVHEEWMCLEEVGQNCLENEICITAFLIS